MSQDSEQGTDNLQNSYDEEHYGLSDCPPPPYSRLAEGQSYSVATDVPSVVVAEGKPQDVANDVHLDAEHDDFANDVLARLPETMSRSAEDSCLRDGCNSIFNGEFSTRNPTAIMSAKTAPFTLDLSTWKLDQDLMHSTESLSLKPNPVWIIKQSRDGRFIATGAHDGSIKIWNLTDDPLNSRNRNFNRARSTTADDTKLLPAKKNHSFFDPSPMHNFTGHQSAITDISWSYSHYFIISSSLDQTVRLWNISNSECLCVFYHGDAVTSVKFHPFEHHLFLSGCFDGRIRLWSISEKRVIHWNQVPNNSITAVEITGDGATAIAGTLNGDILFYELPYLKYDTQITITPPFKALRLSTSRIQYKINGIESFIDAQTMENMIVVGSTDSKVRVYQIRDKSLCKSFKGHVCSTSFFRPTISDNGSIIVSPSEDKAVCLWVNNDNQSDYVSTPSSGTRQLYLDRILFDEQVLCAHLSSTRVYFWKNSFANTFLSQKSFDSSDLNEPLILITSDVLGRIHIYKNESISSALTVRSFKDFALSNHPGVQRKHSSSPKLLSRPSSIKRKSGSKASSVFSRSNSKESVQEDTIILQEQQVINGESKKQTSVTPVFKLFLNNDSKSLHGNSVSAISVIHETEK